MPQGPPAKVTRFQLIAFALACVLLVGMPFVNFTPDLDTVVEQHPERIFPLPSALWADVVQAVLGAGAAMVAFFSHRVLEAGLALRGQTTPVPHGRLTVEDVLLGGLTGLGVFFGLRGLSEAGVWGLSITLFVLVYPTLKRLWQTWRQL